MFMGYTVIEVKENFGNKRIKVKIISREHLSDSQKQYFSSLKRDEAIKYGNAKGWKVLDVEEE